MYKVLNITNIASLLFVSLVIIALLIGKSLNKSQTNNTNKLQVSTSFYPLYFFASEIGKDKTEVKNITPSGSEPHDYDPSTQDIARTEHSNMLVLNGGVEAWGDKIKENLKATKVKIVIAGDGLLTQTVNEDGKSQIDPHIWLNPQLAKKEAHAITQGYIDIDPKNKTYYQDNEKSLDDRLDQLDEKFRKGLQNCQLKDIITSHAAFGYLASRYGLKQIPIAGLSPDAEPSAQQLAEVAKFAKEHTIKYIFFESLVSPKLSETIAKEIGAKTLVLDPIERLSDNDIKQGKNYFTAMEDNLKNLQEALQCSK